MTSTDFSSEIHCTLEKVSLFQNPQYEALSYTWGDSRDTRPIRINGEIVRVRTNLEAALRRLRAEGHIKLWVDALCINQSDDEEKALQVRQMKSIYSKASSVIAWVGVEAEESSRVLDVMLLLSNGAPWKSIQATWREDRFDFWAALKAFLRRPFWSRVWIIQETSVPLNLSIQCGPRHISWDTISRASSQLVFQPMTDSIYHVMAFREAFQSSAPVTLLKALFDTQNFLATDLRDKIYALINLAYDGTKLVPHLSYYQNVQDVFRGLANSILFKNKCSDIISLRQRDGLELENLPSWVPDWSRMNSAYRPWQKELLFEEARSFTFLSDTNSLPYYYFLPGEFYLLKTPRPRIDSQGNLRISGWIIDTVNRLTTSLKDEAFTETSTAPENQTTPLASQPNPYSGKMGDAIAKCLCLGMAFPKGMPRVGDLKCPQGISILQRDYQQILDWFSVNKSFTIAGQSFETYLTKQTPALKKWLATGAFLVSDLVATYQPGKLWLSPLDLDWGRPLFEGVLEKYFYHLNEILQEGMRLFVSDRGYLGMAHQQTRPGDNFCVLSDCRMPVVLRKCEGGYKVVGEAYLHDFTFDKILNAQEFVIC